MDVAFGQHHLSDRQTFGIAGAGKRAENSPDVSRWPVLAKLELAFNSGDGDLEGDDAMHELVAKAVGKVSGPGLLEGCLIFRNGIAKERDNTLVLAQDFRNTVGMNGGIVPSRDGRFGLIPRWRNVAMRPVKNGENLRAGSKMLPLRIGASHVGYERPVAAGSGMEKHR